MKSQIETLKEILELFIMKYNPKARLGTEFVTEVSAGEHTIGIVSESGTAFTTFNVKAKSLQTVDNSHISLWFALFFVSGGLLTVTVVYGKRKTHSKKLNVQLCKGGEGKSRRFLRT